MKPRIYDNAETFLADMSRLPLVEGQAKNADGVLTNAATAISKIKALIPDMFRYRDLLVKAPGGLGNLKSLRRFSDVAAENVSAVTHEMYEESLNELAEEVENLMQFGVAEETVKQLRGAKSQIAQFEYMKNSINQFKGKLQSRMAAVESAAALMVSALTKAMSANKDRTIVEPLKLAQGKLQADVTEIQNLMTAMDQFCDHQVVYNSIMIGYMNARVA